MKHFLFHLVPQHLQKPYTSHLREKPSGGNKCTGKSGRQASQLGYRYLKKKNTQVRSGLLRVEGKGIILLQNSYPN